MDKSLDDKIKEALLEATKEAPEEKDKVLMNIKSSLQEEKEAKEMTKRKRNKSFMPRFAIIASAFLVLFLSSTEYGQATIDRIKTFFQPEKEIVEQIEGGDEEKEYTLEKGEMGYIIYIDQSMYEKEVVEGKDRIVPLYKAENYPPMFMEISQNTDLSPEETAIQIENNLDREYETFENQGIVNDPIEAIHLAAKTGTNHDSILVKYYIVDNTRGGSFIIKMEYIYEAAEGHGARFYHMLKEFEVIDLEDI